MVATKIVTFYPDVEIQKAYEEVNEAKKQGKLARVITALWIKDEEIAKKYVDMQPWE